MTMHEHPPTSANNLARLRVLILSRVTLRGRGWPGRCIFQGIWTVLLWFMAKHDIGAPQSIVRSSFAQNWQKWEFGQNHYIIHRFQAHPCDVVRDISHSYPSNSLYNYLTSSAKNSLKCLVCPQPSEVTWTHGCWDADFGVIQMTLVRLPSRETWPILDGSVPKLYRCWKINRFAG